MEKIQTIHKYKYLFLAENSPQSTVLQILENPINFFLTLPLSLSLQNIFSDSESSFWYCKTFGGCNVFVTRDTIPNKQIKSADKEREKWGERESVGGYWGWDHVPVHER